MARLTQIQSQALRNAANAEKAREHDKKSLQIASVLSTDCPYGRKTASGKLKSRPASIRRRDRQLVERKGQLIMADGYVVMYHTTSSSDSNGTSRKSVMVNGKNIVFTGKEVFIAYDQIINYNIDLTKQQF